MRDPVDIPNLESLSPISLTGTYEWFPPSSLEAKKTKLLGFLTLLLVREVPFLELNKTPPLVSCCIPYSGKMFYSWSFKKFSLQTALQWVQTLVHASYMPFVTAKINIPNLHLQTMMSQHLHLMVFHLLRIPLIQITWSPPVSFIKTQQLRLLGESS